MNEKLMLWFTLLNICVCTANNNNNPSPLIENVSVNCGSSGASMSENGKKWLGDITTRSLTSVRVDGSSTTSTQKLNNAAFDPIPYKTARASRSRFFYEFQVSPGEKIIRLHFSPGSYKGFQRSIDLIDVEAGQFTLLGNFSASLTAKALGVKSFVKEFCMNVEENQLLRIFFSPANENAYAYINGIEIVSVPIPLSYFDVSAFEAVGRNSLVHVVDRNGALEHVYQWNAKAELYLASRNHDDLFPTWTAKKDDNKVKNNTFKVLVDVGFNYLIKLHFSELLLLKMAVRDESLVFKVFIGETFAQSNTDLFNENGENSMKRHGDYLVTMRGHKNDGKSHILISVESYDGYVCLEGLEILKLANTDNSLASPNPVPVPQKSLDNSITMTMKYILSVLGYKNAIFTIVTAIVIVASVIVCELQEISEANSVEEVNKPSERAQRICRHFSLDEIRSATKFYSVDLLIGRGGFGSVYKGTIDGGQETVAVKKLKFDSRQGAREFLTEIETLSELRHVNLVPLIGYCNEYGEMMLVYKYMSGGTLADHLYKNARKNKDCLALTWKQRLNICIRAARGLDYLHTGHGIIHRDVKASNILLDENFEAKVSDFGLAKPEDGSKSNSHVSTNVKGTFGYIDPNYCITREVTRKSDTYAFGVALFEVLCGRPAVISTPVEDERVLVKWVQGKISSSKEDIYQIVDPSLREELSPDSLKIFAEVAERCINDEPKKRPTMSQVVLQLEIALELQDSKGLTALNEKAFAPDDNQSHCPSDGIDLSTIEEQVKLTSSDDNYLTSPPEERQNETEVAGFELPSVENSERKDKRNKKISRFWPWRAFRDRVKPSQTNVLQELGICEADIKTHKFDWDTIVAATHQFSSSIGYRAYKGAFPAGQAIAVKEFEPPSGQDRIYLSQITSGQDFKTEIILLPNFRHQNIIKLLGYCIHGQEMWLVYEFMENENLSSYIGSKQLQWRARFNIIMGIARGLAHLHHNNSQLRVVIHRDLKPENILLDSEMNPTISGFYLARAMEDGNLELDNTCVVGTLWYLSSELLCGGRTKISTKSDVFGFGIIVLEIVSGTRASSYWSSGDVNIWYYALCLWREGRAMEFVDKSLGGFRADEALRCIQVGILCAQVQPDNRPDMTCVIKLLEGDDDHVRDPIFSLPVLPTHIQENDNASDATFEYDDTAELER